MNCRTKTRTIRGVGDTPSGRQEPKPVSQNAQLGTTNILPRLPLKSPVQIGQWTTPSFLYSCHSAAAMYVQPCIKLLRHRMLGDECRHQLLRLRNQAQELERTNSIGQLRAQTLHASWPANSSTRCPHLSMIAPDTDGIWRMRLTFC